MRTEVLFGITVIHATDRREQESIDKIKLESTLIREEISLLKDIASLGITQAELDYARSVLIQ